MNIRPPTAALLGYGNPGAPNTVQGRTFERNNIVTISVGGRNLRVHRQAAPLFQGFITELVASGYAIDAGEVDDWGYNHRWVRINGVPQVGHLSEHSTGTAVDLNARTNPQGRPLRTNMPPTVRQLAARWGLRWGADFPTPDPMHFEVIVRPQDVAGIVARNQASPPAGTGSNRPAPPTTPRPSTTGVISRPATGTPSTGTGTPPTSTGGGGSSSSLFSGPAGAVWRLLVEGALVLGGIAAVVLGAASAASPGKAAARVA